MIENKKKCVLIGEEFEYGKALVVRNSGENMVQVYGPSLYLIHVKENLQQNGFRWSRKNRCWQAHLSDCKLEVAKSIAEKMQEVAII